MSNKMTPQEIFNLINSRDVQEQLKIATKQAQETIERINKANRIGWKDLHKPVTI